MSELTVREEFEAWWATYWRPISDSSGEAFNLCFKETAWAGWLAGRAAL